ncbi:MAG: DNA polymerase III subunit beta [Lactobacillales bacterium]|jgi:DNA polymerase-3 subunit beta|nr:DNA polymerase III subunit beta [Lactobacillales bacterium]
MIKFTIERGILLKGLSHIQSVVERRQTIPILSNVLIEAAGDTLSLRATDNEIEISEKIAAAVEKNGAITVPAHKLYDIVKRLPDGAQLSVSYSPETGQLSITSGRSKFALSCLPADGFPSMAHEEMPIAFDMETKQLLDLINKTSFAISMEETRYNLNGIYLHEKKGAATTLTAVATDGHRLACAHVPLPEGAAGMPGVIIPRKTIAEISKLGAELDGSVSVSLSESQVRFKLADVVLSSRLIDGTYPEYERVIPADNDKVLEADSAVLANVIERVSVVSEKSRGIKLSLSPNLLKVFAVSVDEGSAEDEMDAAYASDPVEIGFNFRYLLDVLAQVKGGTAKITLNDSVSPVIIQDPKDANSLYVLMPMRV